MYLEVIKNDALVSQETNTPYVRSTFCEVKTFVGDRTILALDKTASRMYNVGKEFPLGTLFEGKIITLNTEDYEIGERTVNKITVCTIGEESPVEVANKQLQRSGDDVWVIVNGKSTRPEESKDQPPAPLAKGKKDKTAKVV